MADSSVASALPPLSTQIAHLQATLASRPPISRLAPTPSGHLHCGNLINFLITWLLVRHFKGRLHLRIDDMDQARCRADATEAIFRTLEWMDLDWDEGPTSVDDFHRLHSFTLRQEQFRSQALALMDQGLAYACTCSRKEISALSPNGLYPGRCRGAGHPLRTGSSALRILVSPQTLVQTGGLQIILDQEMGDFVLWRRDDQPAYHLASVLDDLERRTSLLVRGEDLLVSSAAQLHLARALPGGTALHDAAFIHHPLLLARDGSKLSKSRGAQPAQLWRRSDLLRVTAQLLGLPHGPYERASELAYALACRLG